MATSLPLGQLEAFDPQVETFTSYVERVHLFFEANDIKEEKRRSVFLSIVGGAVYNLLQEPPSSCHSQGCTTSRHNCRPEGSL